MTDAQGASALVGYAEETTWGVAPVGTAGSQVVSFTSAKTGGSATGLTNDSTVYEASITIDGGAAQAINIIGSEAQTITELLTQINDDLSDASAALNDDGYIEVTSDDKSASSSVAISDTDLFSSLTDFDAVESATAGTGANADLTLLPFTSFSLQVNREEHQDDSVRSSRQRSFSVVGNRSISGDLSVNFAANVHDDMLESVFHNTFTANVLKVGSTRKSFTMEQQQTDIDIHRLFTGVVCDSMNISIPTDGMVTVDFGLVGKDQQSISGTQFDDTVTEPAETEPFFHADGTFSLEGSAVSYMTSLDVTLSNGLAPNFNLGSNVARDLSYGFLDVTGNATMYFVDATQIQNFLDSDYIALQFTLTDGVTTYTFDLPRIKYTGSDHPVTGQGPIVLTFPFSAFYDGTEETTVKITKS